MATFPKQYGGVNLGILLDTWNVSSNIATNSTAVQADFYLESSYGYWNADARNRVRIWIDGAQVYDNYHSYDLRSVNRQKLVGGVTRTVPHNSDGSKRVIVEAQFDSPDYGGLYVSGTLDLPNLGRASQPSVAIGGVEVGSAEYGQTVDIWTNRNDASFTHRLRVNWNGTEEIIKEFSEWSTTWTIPLSYMNRIPNAASTWGTIYLDTYSDSGTKLVGTKEVRLTTVVPASIVPSIGTSTYAEATAGLAAKFAAFVQGKSTLSFSMSASGAYGSTITGYRVEVNGQTFGSSSGTTAPLATAGSNSIKFVAIDSRGREASVTKSFTVLAYSAPQVSVPTAIRTDSVGTANEDGTYAKITTKGNISSLNSKNNKSFTMRYKATDASTWTTVTLSTTLYTLDTTRLQSGMSTEKAYDIEITATDYFGSATATYQLPTSFTHENYGTKGKAVGGIYDETRGGFFQVPGAGWVKDLSADTSKLGASTATSLSVGTVNYTGDSGWQSVTAFLNGYTGTVWFRKVGPFVEVFGQFVHGTAGDEMGSGVQLTTIPSGYRPSRDFTFSPHVDHTQASWTKDYGCVCTLTTAGILWLQKANSRNLRRQFHEFYLVP